VFALLAAFGAGTADVIEDLRILETLATPPDSLTDAMVASTRTASLVKWGLLAVVEAALARLFLGFLGGVGLQSTSTSGCLWLVARLFLGPLDESLPLRLASRSVGVLLLVAAAFEVAGLSRHPLIGVSILFLTGALVVATPILIGFPGPFLSGVGAAPVPAAGSATGQGGVGA
jgi:hypothetical protein